MFEGIDVGNSAFCETIFERFVSVGIEAIVN
jgi:hypothetical protein